jgi:hypothetical protein
MKRKALVVSGVVVVGAAVFMLWQGNGGRSGGSAITDAPVEASGETTTVAQIGGGPRPRGDKQPGPAGAKLVASTTPMSAETKAAITGMVGDFMTARAEGNAEALRKMLSLQAVFDDTQSEDPYYDPEVRPEWYHPMDPTPENLAHYEDALVEDMLRGKPEEREDFAGKAELTHIIPLEDGRYLVRMYADAVLTRRETAGREVPNSDEAYIPQERRMLVASTPEGWRIVAFPRRDRHPRLADI